ncbi:hypothetical protein M758_6G080500 [Ceratodon purpureus]|nr:hypothetical protein M758_6G080500 [Ceratodon purpureus]
MAALLRSIAQRCRVVSTAASRLNGSPASLNVGGFEGEKSSAVHRVIRGFMNQSGSGSGDGIKSILCPATHSLGVSQGLWGQRAGLVSQYGSMLGAGNQQVRNVMVEVTNDDLERAIRKMKRRLKDDNGIKLLRERQYHRKPSELKVLARKERDKRIAKKAFRAKLKWITARQARGF